MKRFWDKVNKKTKDECWEWLAAKSKAGYGKFNYKGNRSFFAHRAAWDLTNGDIPNGFHVLHKCDNPSCVNPHHLFLGTHQDNMKDRDAKGRLLIKPGELHPSAKLSSAQVSEIRRRFILLSEKQSEIAKYYNVSAMHISRIVRNLARITG